MTKVIFMGTPTFSVPVLEALVENNYEVIAVVTQPDRPVGRKKVLTPPPVKEAAVKLNIPVYQPEKIRQSEELQQIIELKADIIVTAAFGQILPKALLDAPTFGCINVHASLLPELRGGAPIHYALLQGKEKTGITIMYMAEKLDAGDIISQSSINITESDNVGTLHDKLSDIGANLLLETLPEILDGSAKREVQNEEEATFAPNIRRDQEKIDWKQNGLAIFNQVRGLNPWPVAFTTIDGSNVKVWNSNKVTGTGKPGTVIAIEKDGFVVATGDDTAIKITELQPAGKKKMSAETYLNGAGKTLTTGFVIGE